MSDAEGYPRPATEVPRWRASFLTEEAVETAARIAMTVDSPWLVPVLQASPRVVYGAPLHDERPTAPLPVADAVTCALQVCDVLARLHAVGWRGLGCDRHDIRVVAAGDGWRASVVVPHLPPRGRFHHARQFSGDESGEVRGDLCAVVWLLRDLAVGHVPEPLRMWGALRQYVDAPLPPLGDAAVDAALVALCDEDAQAPVADAASLAALLAPLSRDPAAWADRAAAMPRARPRSLRCDWARLIQLGEAELARRPGDPYVVLALAAAIHQRGCVAFHGGDLDAAEADVERAIALDPWLRYRITRGTIRERRGDLRGAAEAFSAVIDDLRLQGPEEEDGPLDGPAGLRYDSSDEIEEAARVFYARGVTRWRLGDVGARDDLEKAAEVVGWMNADPASVGAADAALDDAILRALAAVHRARVGAGEAGARLDLVRVLRRLGRSDEARAEAAVVLTERPDDEALRKRYRKWFGL